MAVGVGDRLRGAALGERLGGRLAVHDVVGAAVLREVARLVDERARLGVRAGRGGVPERTAEGDVAEAAEKNV